MIYALWRGEKLSQKLRLWRKKDKYEVCLAIDNVIVSHLMTHLAHSNEEGLLADGVEGQVHHIPHSFRYCCSIIFHLESL